MKKINKMLNLGLVLIILGSILLNFNRILLFSMDIVDAYGNMTDTNVCNTINKLNEIYYNLMNNKLNNSF